MEALRPNPPPDDQFAELIVRAMAPAWHEAAACSDADPALFFNGSSRGCVSLCESCPVAKVCLWSAMDAEMGQPASDRFGVFGGANPHARHRIALEIGSATVQLLLGAALVEWADCEDRAAASGLDETVLAERQRTADRKRSRQEAARHTRQRAAA